jgi:branched-chain amino acid transport system ATP-binding protein
MTDAPSANGTRPPPSPALDIQGLRAGYNGIEVVFGIDLQIRRGEIMAMFGPNGAGKTTTLLTIMGMLPRMGGRILWDGIDSDLAPHRRARNGVAFVGERSVFQQLTTLANLRLGRGDPDRALEIFPELQPLLGRRAGFLSGGEQQILTMARALAGKPTVLLLDEVSAGLAPLIVARLFEAAQEAASQGVAVLLVEQQIRRALSLANRGVVLSGGTVSFSGTRLELEEHMDSVSHSYFSHRKDHG